MVSYRGFEEVDLGSWDKVRAVGVKVGRLFRAWRGDFWGVVSWSTEVSETCDPGKGRNSFSLLSMLSEGKCRNSLSSSDCEMT